MKKDTEWSGLLKIPAEALVDQLRKELSEKNIEIDMLKSEIQHLQAKNKNIIQHNKIALDNVRKKLEVAREDIRILNSRF